jgi:hypothetical protein
MPAAISNPRTIRRAIIVAPAGSHAVRAIRFRGLENERSNRTGGRGSIVSGHFLDDVEAAWKIADGGLARKQANTEVVRPIVAPARSGPAAKSAT